MRWSIILCRNDKIEHHISEDNTHKPPLRFWVDVWCQIHLYDYSWSIDINFPGIYLPQTHNNYLFPDAWNYGVLCSYMIGLLHVFFSSKSEARIYLWYSKCWEYEDCHWISIAKANLTWFSNHFTFIGFLFECLILEVALVCTEYQLKKFVISFLCFLTHLPYPATTLSSQL